MEELLFRQEHHSDDFLNGQTALLEEKDTQKANRIGADMYLNVAIKEMISLSQGLSGNKTLDYIRTNTAIHELMYAIAVAEEFQSRQEILDKLTDIRQIHRDSPFFIRTQDWPRGYAGDFETIEYIIEGENRSKKNTLGYYLEAVILNTPIVQQHRNKVTHQSRLILNTIMDNNEANILIIGCGSSPDLRLIQKQIANTSAQFTLFDMDEGALMYSAKMLKDINNQCKFVQGNLLRSIKTIEERFDLIVIGGVFDYLRDKTITSILNKLYEFNMKPEGGLFFTNIASGNPYRTWMEYGFNWELIERDEQNIRQLFEKSDIVNKSLNVFKEETGLTYLAAIK